MDLDKPNDKELWNADEILAALFKENSPKNAELGRRLKATAALLRPSINSGTSDVFIINNQSESNHAVDLLSRSVERCGVVTFQLYFDFVESKIGPIVISTLPGEVMIWDQRSKYTGDVHPMDIIPKELVDILRRRDVTVVSDSMRYLIDQKEGLHPYYDIHQMLMKIQQENWLPLCAGRPDNLDLAEYIYGYDHSYHGHHGRSSHEFKKLRKRFPNAK